MASSFLIAYPLPLHIKPSIQKLCFGLPFVQWKEEESFIVTFYPLGILNDQTLQEVQESLSSLFFHPFSITLKGIGHSIGKNGSGHLWIKTEESQEWNRLKKEIDSLLRKIKITPSSGFLSSPHLLLGSFDKINLERLSDYLFEHFTLQFPPILIHSLHLMEIHTSSKKTFFTDRDCYLASPPSFED
jgi:2'-5' RNA ligase